MLEKYHSININDDNQPHSIANKKRHIQNNIELETLSRYIATKYIGSGTFGEIWKAFNIYDKDKKEYAVKVLRNNGKWTLSKREKYKSVFINEAKRIMYLNNIQTKEMGKHFIIQCKEILYTKTNVSILNECDKYTQTQATDISPCIVMELCDCSLLQFIKKHALNGLRIQLNTIRCISAQLFSAMSFMHGIGNCMHSDLKPENILVNIGSIPTIKIIDFGNAIVFNSKIKSFDIQTVCYRAPEILFGHTQYISSLIDMWSIGCILYELLTINITHSKHNRLFQSEDMMYTIFTQLSPFPAYVYNKYTSCYYYDRSIYHSDNSYVKLKTHRKNRLISMHRLQLGNAVGIKSAPELSDFIDLLCCLLDLNPLTRYTSQDAIQHKFIINDSISQTVKNKHSIIKSSNDKQRQNRINSQIKQYQLLHNSTLTKIDYSSFPFVISNQCLY